MIFKHGFSGVLIIQIDLAGSKVNDVALRKEDLTGDEINVVVNEANIAVESIEIYKGKRCSQ